VSLLEKENLLTLSGFINILRIKETDFEILTETYIVGSTESKYLFRNVASVCVCVSVYTPGNRMVRRISFMSGI
jgi:hypothetical protein